MEQWGNGVETGKAEFAWLADDTRPLSKNSGPWAGGVDKYLESCVDRTGRSHWCRKKGVSANTTWLDRDLTCAARATSLAQTTSFATIQLGELMSICTFRVDAFFLPHVLSNHQFNIAVAFHLTSFVFLVYVLQFAELELVPLGPLRLIVALACAMLIAVCNEAFKILYRDRLDARFKVLTVMSNWRAVRCLPPSEWDAAEESCLGVGLEDSVASGAG